jgi:hypothetical protein
VKAKSHRIQSFPAYYLKNFSTFVESWQLEEMKDPAAKEQSDALLQTRHKTLAISYSPRDAESSCPSGGRRYSTQAEGASHPAHSSLLDYTAEH